MTDHPTKNDSTNLSDRLEDAADRATDFAYQQAEEVTQTVTDQAEAKVSNAADAAAAASSEFEQGSVQAKAADQIADHLQDAAAVLRQTDLNAAAKKATAFARENPVLFLGGAALLGFAAARFMKASDRSTDAAQTPDTDPWTGHVTATRNAQSAPTPVQNEAHHANGGAHS